MKHLACPLFAFCSIAAAGCTTSDATLTIENQESFAITDIYIGPSDGSFPTTDNLLDAGPLNPGDAITVSVQCEAYDVEIIDTTGTNCYVADYDLCGTDDMWVLDNTYFNTCMSAPRVRAPQPPATSPVTPAPAR